MWVRAPDAVKPVFDGLGGKKLTNLTKLRGFTLSMGDQVVDTFPSAQDIPDQLDILSAFMSAAAAKPV